MRKLVVFNHVSLDGYFVDGKGDMSWTHADPQDAEWNAFVTSNAGSGGALVLGRVTYDLMVSFWPTPMAAEMMPVVAERMNNLQKIVFSHTLEQAAWNNTILLKGDIAAEIRKLKEASDPDMTLLGSGTIVAQLAQAGLIDEYQFVVNSVVLGKGRTMFEGLPAKLALRLTQSRTFGNGNVFLCYQPVA